MAYDRETLRKRFPHLAAELDQSIMKVSIDSVRSNADDGAKIASRKATGYNPDIVDFLRRCDTDKEALEIVDFMEKRGEISKEYGKKLREQLTNERTQRALNEETISRMQGEIADLKKIVQSMIDKKA